MNALACLGAVLHGRLIDVTKVSALEIMRVRRFASDLQVVRSRLGR